MNMFSNFRGRTFQIAIACLMLCPVALHAQRYLGSIQGEVNDPSGAKVPDAAVTAEETITHYKLTTKSNGAGAYNFPQLNPGTYSITLAATGFKAATTSNVILTAGQSQQVDFNLTTGATTETVVVEANSNSLIDTGSANIATVLSTQEVTDLPNEGRNPYVMATLAPGVLNGGSGGYFQGKSNGFTTPYAGVSVQVVTNGNSGHNRLLLNGTPNDPAERFSGAGYMGFAISPEGVQEVKIQTSIFDAQVGHGNGTVTNVVVRSGNNKLHGAAYYVFKNTYLDANTSEQAGLHRNRGNDQLSQTGFVIDGPIRIPKVYDGRDKTYFMGTYERYQSHQSLPFNTRVPTAAERTGDFSALCNAFDATGFCTSGIQLYVPTSPVDAQGNRTQFFKNNNIAGSITPQGAALVTYFPDANATGGSISASNYISTNTSYPNVGPSYLLRLDQKIKNDTLSIIGYRSGLTQSFPKQGYPKEVSATGYGYHVFRNNRGGSLDYVHTFGAATVLDSRFGLIYHPFGLQYPDNSGFNLGSIGISSAGLPYTSFPGIGLSDGYSGLAAGAGGQVSEDTFGSIEEVLTRIIRRHSVKIGFEGNLIRYNVQSPQSGFGVFNFDRRFTQQNFNTGDASSGDPAASLLLGAFSNVAYNITPAYALQQIYMAPFIQDDWRITDKLTVSLGFRYDYESPFTERYNKQAANFCTTCTNPLQATVPGLTLNGGLQYTSSANRYPYPKDLNNFQPRVGMAYQVHPGTVLRGGFGIIYFNTLETPVGTGFSQTTSYNNYLSNLPVNSMANPFPSGVVLTTGSSLGLSTSLGQSVSFVDPKHVQPKSAQWTVNLQQQFPGNLNFQIAYVGARPTRLEVNHDINVLPQQYYSTAPDLASQAANVTYLNTPVANPLAGQIPQATNLNGPTIARNLLLRPYPEFGSVTELYSSIGSAPYNSLQVQIQKPMKNHFSMQANFTWQKVMLHQGYLNNFGEGSKLYSVQDANGTLGANIFGTVQLPSLSHRTYLERLFLGGWQANTVTRFQNGNLIGAPGGVDIIGPTRPTNGYTNFHYVNTCYINTVGSGNLTGCSIDTLPAYRQRLAYTIQRNSNVIGERVHLKPLVDFSVFKKFVLHEGVNFEIRGEYFNVMNTAIFGGPNTGIGSATFGQSASTSANGQTFFNQANDPRLGQMTARINF